MIRFQCPYCGQGYTVPFRKAGKTADCRKCGQPLTIPDQPDPLDSDQEAVDDLLIEDSGSSRLLSNTEGRAGLFVPVKTRQSFPWTVLRVILLVWFIGFTCATPYYNWEYAQKHGFVRWLLLGELSATLKAVGWPLWIMTPSGSKWTQADKENFAHVFSSMNANGMGPSQKVVDRIKDRTKMRAPISHALAEAELVRDETLSKAHEDMPLQFRTKYIRALRLLRSWSESGNEADLFEGFKLMNEWIDWWNRHAAGFRIPKDVKNL